RGDAGAGGRIGEGVSVAPALGVVAPLDDGVRVGLVVQADVTAVVPPVCRGDGRVLECAGECAALGPLVGVPSVPALLDDEVAGGVLVVDTLVGLVGSIDEIHRRGAGERARKGVARQPSAPGIPVPVLLDDLAAGGLAGLRGLVVEEQMSALLA